MKSISVVAAILVRDGSVFATQRGYGDMKDGWEFPGGKVEPGESPEEALKREILEELGVEIAVGEHLITVETDYPAFHLTMACYLASIISGEPILKEHEAARWLDQKSLWEVAWLPADIEVVRVLEAWLSQG